MTTTLLHAGKAITPKGEIPDVGILIRDGEIETVGPRSGMELPGGAEEVLATEYTAVPGFVDVHIHGAGGHDVMEADKTALGTITGRLAAFGTTSILATTVTASADETCRAVEGISKYISGQYQTNEARAEILGIHFEGPFLSSERRGVHPAQWLQMPCIDAARSLGMVVSIGHTDATYEQARAAVAHGAHHATHVYNAMRPFTHRDPGVIGAVLTTPELTAELIADCVHVDD